RRTTRNGEVLQSHYILPVCVRPPFRVRLPERSLIFSRQLPDLSANVDLPQAGARDAIPKMTLRPEGWRGRESLRPLAGEGGAVGRRRTPVFRRAMAPDEGLPEPLRPERRRVDDGGLAAHHFGQQPAADRAERQAEVVVGEVEPEAGAARERPDDRAHVGQAGAAAEPGGGFLARPERKHLFREGLE